MFRPRKLSNDLHKQANRNDFDKSVIRFHDSIGKSRNDARRQSQLFKMLILEGLTQLKDGDYRFDELEEIIAI